MTDVTEKRSFSLNKPGIFILGIIVGLALSHAYKQLPSGIEDVEISDSPASARVINPFADFQIKMNERIAARTKNYLRPGPLADLLQTYRNSGKYLPLIQAVFEEYNLPQFLAFLPVIESRFIPNSRSRAGAVGIWQLMPGTARDYGLEINRWIDERRDPEKSTVVAAEFLQFLYDRLGNWELVLAAYNCGYPKLRRIMRQENTSNYWQLRRLPRETYNFVPKFYAVLHIFANPEKYGIELPETVEPVAYETIDIEANFSIEQIAKLANVEPSVLKTFNPALTSDIAPSGKYSIRVPVGVKEHFIKQYQENPPDQVEIIYTSYRVKRGDTLSRIAKRFGTSVDAIVADNNLRSSRWIKAGTKLQIATVQVVKDTTFGESDLSIAEGNGNLSTAEKLRFLYTVERNDLSLNSIARYYRVSPKDLKEWNANLKSSKLKKGKVLKIIKAKKDVTYHKIRRGDSLWKLARRHKTSVSNLRRWNQLPGSRIYPGELLVVALE